MDEKSGEEAQEPNDGPDGVGAHELLKQSFEAVAEAGYPQFLGFTPPDEGVSVTRLPKGSDMPVTLKLRVVSPTVLPPETARRIRRRFGWPDPAPSTSEPPESGR